MNHIRSKSLTNEMVNIAPMVSHQFWKLCLEAFAMQLIEEGQPVKAVIYLLVLHKVDDSLKVLMEKGFHREAWVLAKLKMPMDAPIFSEISRKWRADLDLYGDYETAAVV